jgi:hypothetical protein
VAATTCREAESTSKYDETAASFVVRRFRNTSLLRHLPVRLAALRPTFRGITPTLVKFRSAGELELHRLEHLTGERMKLHRLCDVTPDGRGILYRQGRLQGAIAAVVLAVAFGGAPVVWYCIGAPGYVWGLCAAVAVLVVPLVIGDFLAKLRDTNWVVWIRPDAIWINFRSYQDRGSTDTETVVRLEFAEIAEVRRAGEVYYTPGTKGGSVRHSVQSLEIVLNHDRTDELAAAMAVDRTRPAPERRICGVGVTTRPSHFPVNVPQPGTIRIAWRGGTGNWVAPSLSHVLSELAGMVATGESTQTQAPDWRQLSDAELDDRIVQLVTAGNKIAAVELLRRRGGLSTTDARRFVDELLEPART